MTKIEQALTTWAKGKSTNTAAKQLGVSWHTAQSWMLGKVKPRPRDVAHIASVIGVPVSDLHEAANS